MPNHFDLFKTKMDNARLPAGVIHSFKHYYNLVVKGDKGYVPESAIKPVPKDVLPKILHLSKFKAKGEASLGQTIHIVLNGGLGTSMGLLGPKSLLRVKNGLTFMDIIVAQTKAQNVHLGFMNSFNTENLTIAALKKIAPGFTTYHFCQNRYPKIDQSNLKPVTYPQNPTLEWNPPGHGDIYASLYASGLLRRLLDRGIRYALVSNVDNLRAQIDANILGYFVTNKMPFLIEVAHKTAYDVKGGHLAYSKKGGLVLRELGQCLQEDLPNFFDLEKYPFFNTNNIWLDLEYVHNFIEKHGFIPLPMILNDKTVDYRNAKSPRVYQIESAMGAAVAVFENAAAIHVPRARLLAVKTTNDLMAVRSNCYTLDAAGTITLNHDCCHPQISLDPTYFGKIDDFERRLANMPSLLNCKSLKVQGDFIFEPNVVLEGHVHLVNTTPTQIKIEKNTTISGEKTY